MTSASSTHELLPACSPSTHCMMQLCAYSFALIPVTRLFGFFIFHKQNSHFCGDPFRSHTCLCFRFLHCCLHKVFSYCSSCVLPFSPCLTTNTAVKIKSLSFEKEEGKNDARSRSCACHNLSKSSSLITRLYHYVLCPFYNTDLLVSLLYWRKANVVGIVNFGCFVVKYLSQGILRRAGVDILVFFLPFESFKMSKRYAL